jgi:flagellar biosynthesis/type III secretory pathway protein FliH
VNETPPTQNPLTGGKMIFAAKGAVERKAMEKGWREGRQEGRQEGRREGRQEGQEAERDRIERELAALKKNGINVPPEIARIIARKSAPGS